MPESTLFIPDISGFTHFVKSNEVSHSKHIIEELINIIVKVGSDTLELAEIEGDAVFFYKFEQRLTIDEVNSKAKAIFEAFYKHISQYEHKRICNCGACSQAVNLKLKFVVHTGDIRLAEFSTGKAKPYGTPVIVTHRLLKNKIGLNEYILYTNDFLKDKNTPDLDGSGLYEDRDLGNIDFQYLKIDDWKPDVSFDQSSSVKTNVDIEIEASKTISKPIDILHQYISDFRYRHYWNEEADKVIFNKDKMNRAGTEHYCIVNGKDFFFDTIKPQTGHGEWSYGEILKNPMSPLKYLESYYLMSPLNESETQVRFVMRASVRWKVQLLLLPMMKKMLKNKANDILSSISKSIENHMDELSDQHSSDSQEVA